MRYRIQVTVGAGHLSALIEAACKNNPDPDLRVEPVEDNPLAALSPAPKRRATPVKPRAGRIPRITERGRQRQEVVEKALKTGPKRWSELRAAIGDAGLPQGTLNSLISKWQTEGKIRRSDDGLWSLVENAQAAATA